MVTILDLLNECNHHDFCPLKDCWYYYECQIFKEKFKMTPEEFGDYRFIEDVKQGEFIWK